MHKQLPIRLKPLRSKSIAELAAPAVVVTAQRSGTHLAMDLIRKHYPSFQSWKLPGENLDRLYLPLDVLRKGKLNRRWSRRAVIHVLSRPQRPLIKAHYVDTNLDAIDGRHRDISNWVKNYGTFIYIIRDPRRMLPSLLAFQRSMAPLEGREAIKDFFTFEIQKWVAHVRAWTERPGIHVVRFEDIIEQPADTAGRLGDILGERSRLREPVLPRRLKTKLRSRLIRLAGLTSESTEILTFEQPRRWQSLADEELDAALNNSAGEVMTRFGYR